MSNPVDVCWYTSAMVGAPALSGQAGKLIEVLDACLLTGFGSKTLSSLVVASGVATATVSTGHEFLDYAVVLVAGSAPSGLNGKKRIAVVNSTTFTFDATGISDQTATGTITAKMAPPGAWSKAFSGTNKAAYQSNSIASTGLLLRVDDTTTTYGGLIAYETMTDVDTGSGPSVGTWYLAKSDAASSSPRPWRLYADDVCCYVFVANNNTYPDWYQGMLFFGDPVPVMSMDAYHGMLIADYNGAGNTYLMGLGSNNRYGSIARSHTQIGGAIVTARLSHSSVGGIIGNQSSPVAAPAYQLQHEFLCAPVEVWTHGESVFRAWMPGLYSPLHPGGSLTDGALMTPMQGGGISERTLQITRNVYNALAMDIIGPWR